MKYIAHRGNTNGKFESYENEPNYIDKAINEGFEVEVDVWYIKTEQYGWQLFLGHDKPQYRVDFRWFSDRLTRLWIHCKNIEAVEIFSESGYEFNFFWHQEDQMTLTSHKHVWVYPGNQPIKNSIAVMPEINNDDVSLCSGICSDHIKKYRDENSDII
jgi:hypothetical protein